MVSHPLPLSTSVSTPLPYFCTACRPEAAAQKQAPRKQITRHDLLYPVPLPYRRPEAAAQKQASRKQITDVGDGVLEGVGALGQSFLRGFKSIVEKPVQGAKAKGVSGGCFFLTTMHMLCMLWA